MRLVTWIAGLFAVAISVTAAFACLYYFKLISSAASTKPALTVDQILASLSTNITILGALIAVGGIVVGMIALFGYAELRTSTMRKTEDDLVKIIQVLEKSGDLGQATALVLIEAIAPNRVVKLSGAKQSSPDAQASASNEKVAETYPEDGQK